MPSSRYAPWIIGAPAALLVALAVPWPYVLASQVTIEPTAAEPFVEDPTSGLVAPRSQPERDPPALAAEETGSGDAAVTLGDISYDAELQRFVAPAGDKRAVLTLQPDLQARLRRVLAEYRVPWGATVLIEPRSGRVLAMAEYSQAEPNARDISLRALAPAASVFKIVTSAALLERGIEPQAEICYHGGKHRIEKRNLADDPRRDRRCLTLASALGHSANVVFAKLADRDLPADALRSVAGRFLFNAAIPFARPVEVSRAEISDDPFERATTAAGFGPVRLSPLHAALLAAIVANGGVFVPPEIVDRSGDPGAPPRHQAIRVIDPRVASALAEMMRTTVTEGTARRVFRRTRRGSPLAEVTVAGKTGSLSDRQPFRDYSWFVGFAPVENPQVAVATVIVNQRLWRVKAPFVAHEALQEYFGSGLSEAQAALWRAPRTARR
jgi:penicillin-binding protein A